ncbi:MAG: hypothetical protein IPG54_01295 [Sphingomonadales bacterium]|jgi:hypothetical protein|nr:hypothetical protein [Sphingomonadales bacterium]MBK9003663.1 hypothetical protein [Sphingomonadales bacterium]MBK9268837.1 hypothetical protein [Sphingomonadales bacterium]MBP6434947.1 hypothetical protein [Sphingorhabdus sp.]
MRIAPCLFATIAFLFPGNLYAAKWSGISKDQIAALHDDDLDRHQAEVGYLDGLAVSEIRFSENGFQWHLLRFTSAEKPQGPLWIVPHDDENAAFEAMIAALRQYGGTGIAVNTGPASTRRQPGVGNCGVRAGTTTACDPNRNFDLKSPLFTANILDQHSAGQPIIALHTNSHGFSGDGEGGRGDISMLDARAYRQGIIRPRADGHFGNRSVPSLDDPDIYAILPYPATKGISETDNWCRTALNAAGANVWHERVGTSDGSLSNYVALNLPEVGYLNAEAKRDDALSVAAEAQRLIVDSYLSKCVRQP